MIWVAKRISWSAFAPSTVAPVPLRLNTYGQIRAGRRFAPYVVSPEILQD